MREEGREVEGTRESMEGRREGGDLRRGKGATVELGRELNTNGG